MWTADPPGLFLTRRSRLLSGESEVCGNVKKSDLSPARRRLVELMQRLDFGQVENLLVRDGEPVWEPGPRVHREVKFPRGEDAPPRPGSDFALKQQVRELLALLDQHPDTTLERLEVKGGLPFRAVLPEP